MDFGVCILGTDTNAYYMARNFHEAYGIKPHLIGKVGMAFTSYSSIVSVELEPDLWNAETLRRVLEEHAQHFRQAHPSTPLVLVATNDTYVRLVVENEEFLKQYYIFNYPGYEIVNNCLLKQNFYRVYQGFGLDMPKTVFFDCKRAISSEQEQQALRDEVQDLMLPVILKPGDGVKYHTVSFAGQAKVYKLESVDELIDVLQDIQAAGYDDIMIIQEYIPGDDSLLFDAIYYGDTNAKAQFLTFAQIGLQEHTPDGIGNCTVLVNGYSEFGKVEETREKLVSFMERIGFCGIAEFDLKYDTRDGIYKVLEINPRQARSSYYLTPMGYNLAECLIDDLVYHKTKDFVFIQDKMVLSFVPTSVIRDYVVNDKLKAEIATLKKEGKYCRPLHYEGDKNLKRKLWLYIRDLNYRKKYKNNTW